MAMPSRVAVFCCVLNLAMVAEARDKKDRSDNFPVLDFALQDIEWSGEVTTSAIRAGITPPETEYGGAGYQINGTIAAQRDIGNGQLRLEYGSGYRFYDNETRSDQWRNRFSGRYRLKIDKDVFLAVSSHYATNLSTVESRSSDQTEIMAMAEYSPGNHRFRAYGGWRWRDYDDNLSSNGNGPVAEIDYRYKFGRSNFLNADIRHEDIESTTARLGYRRTRARAFYTHPLGSDWQIKLGSSLYWLEFDNRLSDGSGSPIRKDFVITPEVELVFDISKALFLEARTQYLFRDSNDPDYDIDSHRVSLTAGYRF